MLYQSIEILFFVLTSFLATDLKAKIVAWKVEQKNKKAGDMDTSP